MDAVLNWLWQGGAVAIVAAGTLHLLDRTRAAVRCLVCWAALVVVVLLPLVALTMAAASPIAPPVSTAAPILTVPVAWWTSSALIAAAWTIWTAFYAIRLARALVVVRRARARCSRFHQRSNPHWHTGGARQSGRPARLVLSDRVSAAAVFGCGRPVIAVAPTLIARLDADELDRVVIHEWAHVQRRDDLANIAQLLVRAVAGWHPAVWWLDRRLSIEQELACDETVVAVTGGAKSYASCLVKLASLRAGQSDVLLASGALSSSGLTPGGAPPSRQGSHFVCVGTPGRGPRRCAACRAGTWCRTAAHRRGRGVGDCRPHAAAGGQRNTGRGAASRDALQQSAGSRAALSSDNGCPAARIRETAQLPSPAARNHLRNARAKPSMTRARMRLRARRRPLKSNHPLPRPLRCPPLKRHRRRPSTPNRPPRGARRQTPAWRSAAVRKAGVATAGAFTRFAKKITGSF